MSEGTASTLFHEDLSAVVSSSSSSNTAHPFVFAGKVDSSRPQQNNHRVAGSSSSTTSPGNEDREQAVAVSFFFPDSRAVVTLWSHSTCSAHFIRSLRHASTARDLFLLPTALTTLYAVQLPHAACRATVTWLPYLPPDRPPLPLSAVLPTNPTTTTTAFPSSSSGGSSFGSRALRQWLAALSLSAPQTNAQHQTSAAVEALWRGDDDRLYLFPNLLCTTAVDTQSRHTNDCGPLSLFLRTKSFVLPPSLQSPLRHVYYGYFDPHTDFVAPCDGGSADGGNNNNSSSSRIMTVSAWTEEESLFPAVLVKLFEVPFVQTVGQNHTSSSSASEAAGARTTTTVAPTSRRGSTVAVVVDNTVIAVMSSIIVALQRAKETSLSSVFQEHGLPLRSLRRLRDALAIYRRELTTNSQSGAGAQSSSTAAPTSSSSSIAFPPTLLSASNFVLRCDTVMEWFRWEMIARVVKGMILEATGALMVEGYAALAVPRKKKGNGSTPPVPATAAAMQAAAAMGDPPLVVETPSTATAAMEASAVLLRRGSKVVSLADMESKRRGSTTAKQPVQQNESAPSSSQQILQPASMRYMGLTQAMLESVNQLFVSVMLLAQPATQDATGGANVEFRRRVAQRCAAKYHMSVADAAALLSPPAYLASHKDSRALFFAFVGRHVARRCGLHYNEALRRLDRIVTRDVQCSTARPSAGLAACLPMQRVVASMAHRALDALVRRRRSGQSLTSSAEDCRWLVLTLTVHAACMGCFTSKPLPHAVDFEEDVLRWVELLPQAVRQEISLFQKGSSVLSLDSSCLSNSDRSPRAGAATKMLPKKSDAASRLQFLVDYAVSLASSASSGAQSLSPDHSLRPQQRRALGHHHGEEEDPMYRSSSSLASPRARAVTEEGIDPLTASLLSHQNHFHHRIGLGGGTASNSALLNGSPRQTATVAAVLPVADALDWLITAEHHSREQKTLSMEEQGVREKLENREVQHWEEKVKLFRNETLELLDREAALMQIPDSARTQPVMQQQKPQGDVYGQLLSRAANQHSLEMAPPVLSESELEARRLVVTKQRSAAGVVVASKEDLTSCLSLKVDLAQLKEELAQQQQQVLLMQQQQQQQEEQRSAFIAAARIAQQQQELNEGPSQREEDMVVELKGEETLQPPSDEKEEKERSGDERSARKRRSSDRSGKSSKSKKGDRRSSKQKDEVNGEDNDAAPPPNDVLEGAADHPQCRSDANNTDATATVMEDNDAAASIENAAESIDPKTSGEEPTGEEELLPPEVPPLDHTHDDNNEDASDNEMNHEDKEEDQDDDEEDETMPEEGDDGTTGALSPSASSKLMKKKKNPSNGLPTNLDQDGEARNDDDTMHLQNSKTSDEDHGGGSDDALDEVQDDIGPVDGDGTMVEDLPPPPPPPPPKRRRKSLFAEPEEGDDGAVSVDHRTDGDGSFCLNAEDPSLVASTEGRALRKGSTLHRAAQSIAALLPSSHKATKKGGAVEAMLLKQAATASSLIVDDHDDDSVGAEGQDEAEVEARRQKKQRAMAEAEAQRAQMIACAMLLGEFDDIGADQEDEGDEECLNPEEEALCDAFDDLELEGEGGGGDSSDAKPSPFVMQKDLFAAMLDAMRSGETDPTLILQQLAEQEQAIRRNFDQTQLSRAQLLWKDHITQWKRVQKNQFLVSMTELRVELSRRQTILFQLFFVEQEGSQRAIWNSVCEKGIAEIGIAFVGAEESLLRAGLMRTVEEQERPRVDFLAAILLGPLPSFVVAMTTPMTTEEVEEVTQPMQGGQEYKVDAEKAEPKDQEATLKSTSVAGDGQHPASSLTESKMDPAETNGAIVAATLPNLAASPPPQTFVPCMTLLLDEDAAWTRLLFLCRQGLTFLHTLEANRQLYLKKYWARRESDLQRRQFENQDKEIADQAVYRAKIRVHEVRQLQRQLDEEWSLTRQGRKDEGDEEEEGHHATNNHNNDTLRFFNSTAGAENSFLTTRSSATIAGQGKRKAMKPSATATTTLLSSWARWLLPQVQEEHERAMREEAMALAEREQIRQAELLRQQTAALCIDERRRRDDAKRRQLRRPSQYGSPIESTSSPSRGVDGEGRGRGGVTSAAFPVVVSELFPPTSTASNAITAATTTLLPTQQKAASGILASSVALSSTAGSPNHNYNDVGGNGKPRRLTPMMGGEQQRTTPPQHQQVTAHNTTTSSGSVDRHHPLDEGGASPKSNMPPIARSKGSGVRLVPLNKK